MTRWRNLQRSEDDRTSVTLLQDRLWVDQQGSSSAQKDLRVQWSSKLRAASREDDQQSKGRDSCPAFSTHEVPCETLCPALRAPRNSKYCEELERLQG